MGKSLTIKPRGAGPTLARRTSPKDQAPQSKTGCLRPEEEIFLTFSRC